MAISTFDILYSHEKNTISKKPFEILNKHLLAINECEELIRNGEYRADYDLDGDGFLTADDYNLLYDIYYGKWDRFTNHFMVISHVKKLLASGEYEEDYDLDGDGTITDFDLNIARWWSLYDKIPRANFEEV